MQAVPGRRGNAIRRRNQSLFANRELDRLHPPANRDSIATGSKRKFLLFWKTGEAEDFHRVKLKGDSRGLHLSSDGQHLVTAHHDGHLRIHLMDAKTDSGS